MNQNLDIFNGFSRDEWIAPDIAKQYLERNVSNRNMNSHVISRYSKIIKEDKFFYGNGLIAFNDAGELVDGQHRLAAIARSGKTVKMVVVRGLSVSARANFDTGRKRNASDVLGIEGHQNRIPLASGSKLILAYQRNTDWGTDQEGFGYEIDEVIDFVEKNKEAINKSIAAVIGLKGMFSPSVCVMTHFVLGEISEDDRDVFFEQVKTGEGLRQYDPAWTLRKWAYTNNQGKRGKQKTAMQVAVVFKAWNAFRDKSEIKLLRWTTEGSNAERFPTPR